MARMAPKMSRRSRASGKRQMPKAVLAATATDAAAESRKAVTQKLR